ncbi:hypothetical protein DRQ20_05190, partial [bacterium]
MEIEKGILFVKRGKMESKLGEIFMADIRRVYVLRDWVKGRINGIQASMLLGVSHRHALRLRRKFEREGLKGILRRKRGKKAVSEEIKREICRLYDEIYQRRLNIMHFKDKLEEVHGIRLISAYSPQAKGRIERSFGTFQGRLINELWIR